MVVPNGDASRLVSVIIPAHNADGTLAATLGSAIAQTYPEFEIIVVDDGSADRTAALVKRFAAKDRRIRLVQQSNRGVAAARNAGIAAARGTFVAPLDADDLWHPRALELRMEIFARSSSSLGFVYAWSRRIDERGIAISDQGEPRFEGRVFEQLLAFNFLNNASAALFRKSMILAVGGFDEGLHGAGLQGAEDLALALAIAERAPVGLAPCYLVGYRSVSGSMSANGSRMRQSIERVLSRVEWRKPALSPKLLQLGRMHADLYASALGFNARDWELFARLLVRGVAREPLSAMRLLVCAAMWRFREAAGVGLTGRNFLDLEPDERLPRLPLQCWLENSRARTIQSILASDERREKCAVALR